jgi:triosephosphate isomerase (TIM)
MIGMNTPIIISNTKSYITNIKSFYTLQENIWDKLDKEKYKYHVALPSSLINIVKRENWSGFEVGAQNLETHQEGAHTGSNNIHNLISAGATFVILGHSEIRANNIETSDIISYKVDMSLKNKLNVVLCIGESVRDPDLENKDYLDDIKKMLKDSLHAVDKKLVNGLIIAYEPIWAIGSSNAANPLQVLEVCVSIRRLLSQMFGIDNAKYIKVIYGGSVDASNARDFITHGSCDGVLVGKASMDAEEFAGIVNNIYKED